LDRAVRWLVLLAAAGCAGQGAPCAVENIAGTLPGVTITVRGDTCSLVRGQSATFSYEVDVSPTVPAIFVQGSGGGCGSCLARTSDPATWITMEIAGTSDSGDPQTYCFCDVGCCAPDVDHTVTMTPGVTTGVITWSGRTWSGPSDTGNPMGDFFEPGLYYVSVMVNGETAGMAVAHLPIEVR
jgi:hypothetical protein